MEIYLNLINLTEDQWEKLEILAALDCSHEHIATYFDIPFNIFEREASNKNSQLSQRLRAGKVKQDLDERLGLYGLARKGDVSAHKQIFEIKRTKAFKISKLDIMGGFENEGTLDKLMDYVQSGTLHKASVEEQIYVDALRFIKDMDGQYGQRATIKYIVEILKVKHQRASEMYSEAINLFYSDNSITKKALRKKYAAMIEAAALVVLENAQSSVDMKIHTEMIMQAAKLQELDKADPAKLPKEMYQKPVRVFTLDAAKAGLPEINRNDLAAEIDALDLPEAIKSDIKQDALIEQLSIPAKLDRIIANNNE